MGEVKFGELKGVDRNGNKYFENTEYPFGQHRWIEYKVGNHARSLLFFFLLWALGGVCACLLGQVGGCAQACDWP